MTNTTIYNAVSLGTTSSLTNQSPTKTTLQTTTTTVTLVANVTSASVQENQSQEVEIYWQILPVSLTADATLPPIVGPNANLLRAKLAQRGGTARYTLSATVPNTGGYLYTWWNSPALAPSGSAPTLTLTSVELP